MRTLRLLLLAAFVLALPGCFHAKIETGLEPGTRKIEKPWALSFIGGLIPPSPVDASEACPSGVALVETQLSFLNMLVANLTFGLVTPMQIDVTCAAGARGAADLPQLVVPEGAKAEATAAVFDQAARQSAESGQAVTVRIR